MNINELIENYNLYNITDFEAAGFEQFIPDDGFRRYDLSNRGLRIWEKFTERAQFHIAERYRQKRIEYVVTYNITETDHGIVTNKKDSVEDLMTKRFFSLRYKISRDDGPAVLRLKKDGKILMAEWWRDNVDITEGVEKWISENRMPTLAKWNNEHFSAYKQKFFGPVVTWFVHFSMDMKIQPATLIGGLYLLRLQPACIDICLRPNNHAMSLES